MTLKDKIIFLILAILTLGIYPILIFKKKSSSTSSELSSSEKFSVDLDKLKSNIGGIENIIEVEYTHTKIKIFFENKALVNVETLSKLKGISGVFATSKFVTLIVGNTAKTIAKHLM